MWSALDLYKFWVPSTHQDVDAVAIYKSDKGSITMTSHVLNNMTFETNFTAKSQFTCISVCSETHSNYNMYLTHRSFLLGNLSDSKTIAHHALGGCFICLLYELPSVGIIFLHNIMLILYHCTIYIFTV